MAAVHKPGFPPCLRGEHGEDREEVRRVADVDRLCDERTALGPDPVSGDLDGCAERTEDVDDLPIAERPVDVEARHGHVSVRDRRCDERERRRREVAGHVGVRRAVPLTARRPVQPVVGRHVHAEPTHHLDGQLDIRFGSNRRDDADLHALRGEGAGEEETGQELGAHVTRKARRTASKGPANLDGWPAVSPEGDGARPEGAERIEERTHRPFPEARVSRQRRRTREQGRDSRQ